MIDASCSYKAVSRLVGMLRQTATVDGHHTQLGRSSDTDNRPSNQSLNGNEAQRKEFVNQSFSAEKEDVDVEHGEMFALEFDRFLVYFIEYKKKHVSYNFICL